MGVAMPLGANDNRKATLIGNTSLTQHASHRRTAFEGGNKHARTGGASKLGTGIHMHVVKHVRHQTSNHGAPWSQQDLADCVVSTDIVCTM